MNDLVVGDITVIPVVYQPGVAAILNKLHAPISGWDNNMWNLRDWYRDA